MSIDNFLESTNQTDLSLTHHDTLRTLSGINRTDAHRIANAWRDWDDAKVLETIQEMKNLSASDPSVEFATLFKAATSHLNPKIRAASVSALSQSPDLEAAIIFAQLIERDDTDDVKCAAAEAIAMFVETDNSGRRLPPSHHRKILASLTTAIQSQSTPLRGKALVALALIPEHETDTLIAEHFDSHPTEEQDAEIMQAYALTAMGKSGKIHWMDKIYESLSNPSPSVRIAAVRAFGLIVEDDEFAPLLNETLDDHVLEVQLATIQALRDIGTESARSMLNESLKSSEPSVRASAQSSLQFLKEEDELMYAVSPEMIRRGLYGIPFPDRTRHDMTRYDAPTQEGWANLSDDGQERDADIKTDDIGEDMEDYLESDEFFRASNN